MFFAGTPIRSDIPPCHHSTVYINKRPSQRITIAPEQLIVGFSFGSSGGSGKSVYISPEDAGKAWAALPPTLQPRGAMYAVHRLLLSLINPGCTRSTQLFLSPIVLLTSWCVSKASWVCKQEHLVHSIILTPSGMGGWGVYQFY